MKSSLARLWVVLLSLAAGSTLDASPVYSGQLHTSYQAVLAEDGAEANGNFDFEFRLMDAITSGTQVASPVTLTNVSITNGMLTTQLAFTNGVVITPFSTTTGRWLEVRMKRSTNAGPFITLSPRQRVGAVPYALQALNVDAGGVQGTLAAASLAGTYNNALTLNNAGNQFTGTYNGNAAGLTNLNASSLASGTVNDARISANIARMSQVWATNGNGGTAPGTHFLGTTDNQPLELKVNHQRALRLEPNSAGAPNVIGGAQHNFVAPGVVGATIGGGGATNGGLSVRYTNSVASDYGTVGGGFENRVGTNATAASIVGGVRNMAGGTLSAIGGGRDNEILSSTSAAIAGGEANRIAAGGSYSVIAGGVLNRISTNSSASIVGGGSANVVEANSDYSVISGGRENHIGTNIQYGTIPGGFLNTVSGDFGFAAGNRAKANHAGSFVWADSTEADFGSTGTNQFLIRASGGVGIGTATPAKALHVADRSSSGLTYPLKLSNEYPGTYGTAVGILFQADDGPSRGKGALVYERTDSLNRGKFHFLQEPNVGANNAAINNAVMTIANNGNVGIANTNPAAKLDVSGSVRIQVAGTTITVNADGTVNITSSTNITFNTTGDMNLSGRNVSITASGALNVSGAASANVTSSGSMNIHSTGTLDMQGSTINLN